MWLQRLLEPTCDAAAPPGAPCDVTLHLHDAYSTAIEPGSAGSGVWTVVDDSEPLWAESNWPGQMCARTWTRSYRVAACTLVMRLGRAGGEANY